jgi:hypothetical protein
MDENKKNFALTELFVVTGCCFLAFSFLLRIIDGTILPVFTWIGAVSLLLGSINFIGNHFTGKEDKKLH